jgi:hypothetical protein
VIVIADDCSFEKVLSYVRMGFDDVISLPEKRDVLVQRLLAQLHTEHLYVETPNYFGPDRRRMDIEVNDSRRQGMAGHARFYIRRLPDQGIHIVRHEIYSTEDSERQAIRAAS